MSRFQQRPLRLSKTRENGQNEPSEVNQDWTPPVKQLSMPIDDEGRHNLKG
jgi:hypothetical protein